MLKMLLNLSHNLDLLHLPWHCTFTQGLLHGNFLSAMSRARPGQHVAATQSMALYAWNLPMALALPALTSPLNCFAGVEVWPDLYRPHVPGGARGWGGVGNPSHCSVWALDDPPGIPGSALRHVLFRGDEGLCWSGWKRAFVQVRPSFRCVCRALRLALYRTLRKSSQSAHWCSAWEGLNGKGRDGFL